jgi:hypothetical protein
MVNRFVCLANFVEKSKCSSVWFVCKRIEVGTMDDSKPCAHVAKRLTQPHQHLE